MTEKKPLRDRLAAGLMYAATMAACLTAVLGWMRVQPPTPAEIADAVQKAMPPMAVAPADKGDDKSVFAQGWVPPSDRELADSRDPAKTTQFDQTPAGKMVLGEYPDTFLWRDVRKALGLGDTEYINVNQQSVGCCTGCGGKHSLDISQAADIVVSGKRWTFKKVSVESIYGPSRVEIGGGRIRGDGSSGAWVAQAIRKIGVLPMERFGAVDLTVFSPARAREWGQSGMPNDLEPQAREHVCEDVALVRTWAECQKAIAQHYAIFVCSNVGFDGMNRDADGFVRASGTWAHCMCICGIRGGPRPGGFILNSWGDDAHRGPVWPADAPKAGFWADAKTIERMLSQGDSFAVSGFKGFPKRGIDAFIRHQPAPNVRQADLFALAH